MPETRPGQSSASFPAPEDIWVLGAGRFGELAVKRLSRRLPQARLAVIDVRPDRLDRIRSEYGAPSLTVHEGDGILLLEREDLPGDLWVVPAVPRHVAFQWLVNQLNRSGTAAVLPVPREVDEQVPNPYRVSGGTVYSSHATFLCPDSCSEPEDICTYTRRPRPTSLFEILSRIQVPEHRAVVVRSRQLAPGVGGYPMAQLCSTRDRICSHPGRFIIATSCRCHGVINAMAWESGKRG